MIWLSSSTLTRLRDQLRTRGQRPSVALPPGETSPDLLDELYADAEYGPLCEAMYLMMSADGEVSDAEREVLRGALKNLSGDALRTAQIEKMLQVASERADRDGRDTRLAEVCRSLEDDTARAEVAFVLAAAIAFADSAIADQENETLSELAGALGIDESRANELLDSVEDDLKAEGGGEAR